MKKPGLSAPSLAFTLSSCPTDRSKVIPLLHLLFGTASVVSYVAGFLVIIYFKSLILFVPREGCAL